jgi:putative oxidoreductase
MAGRPRRATGLELTFGLALVLGVRVRAAATGAALLLAGFAVSMAISFGVKSPLDYSVFTASACALLLRATLDARAGRPTDRRPHRGAPPWSSA